MSTPNNVKKKTSGSQRGLCSRPTKLQLKSISFTGNFDKIKTLQTNKSKTEVPRDVRNSKVRNRTSTGEIGLKASAHSFKRLLHGF